MKDKGKVYVVGLGPGGGNHLTARAQFAIKDSQVIVGYHVYISLIEGLIAGKEVISTGMGQELARCQKALELAVLGKKVALVSSGDPGIYGMAGPFLGLAAGLSDGPDVEIVPGITAATMGAAVLGAPLMHDLAVISLSDLLTPWEVIEKRLRMAAEGDFVTVLYNPRSNGRPGYITRAREIFLLCREKETPVGIVRNAAREGQIKIITTLKELPEEDIDMFSVVIIGNSQTFISGEFIITPRGYKNDSGAGRDC